jgi:hypothetical protein
MAETRESIKDPSGTVPGMAEQAADLGKASIPASKDKPQEATSGVVGAVGDKVQEVAAAAAEKVGEVGQDVTDLIRRYPLPALLVGIGVGFLLAHLLRGTPSATT